MPDRYDVAVIGAGAAGLMCAAVAGQRGRSVVLVDHAERLAEKIRISGGGRCNFTNREVGVANFVSGNRDFARSVFSRYGSRDFIALVERHGIAYHEKHRGQLFCDDSSERIIRMLVDECASGGVQWRRPVRVREVVREPDGFAIATDGGALHATRLVVATGGLSIPKIGATDFAYRLARQFGVSVIEPRPALVPFTFADWTAWVGLAGAALEVEVACTDGIAPGRFREDLLVTHRGLSGPAGLQISTYWKAGATLELDLVPDVALGDALVREKATSRQTLSNVLARFLPARFASCWVATVLGGEDRRVADLSDRTLRAVAAGLEHWTLRPDGTEGYRKAEVTAGGVDTRALSQKTLEVRAVPGLHFIGEAVDMTGWLGGYNFQWAWSSGFVAGQAV